jgi:hypothetical protein
VTVTLADEYPKAQARLRELIHQYRDLGPAGAFGVMMLDDLQTRAAEAAAAGDVVAMLRLYAEMGECK